MLETNITLAPERADDSERERLAMKREIKNLFRSFSIELLVYSAIVVAYFYAVLHFLGGELEYMFLHKRTAYAVLSLLLIIAQGFVLEYFTRALLKFIRGGKKE